MKRRVLFSLCAFVFFLSGLGAEETIVQQEASVEAAVAVEQEAAEISNVSFFSYNPEFSLQVLTAANNYHDFQLYTLSFGTIFQCDMKELSGRTGFNFAYNKIDYTLDVKYGPVFFENLQAGPRIIIHTDWYHNYYFETDVLLGAFVSYKPFFWFKTDFSIFYQLKSTDIYALKHECNWFYSNCEALELGLYFYPLDWMTINLTLSSFSFFRYHLFCSPDFKADLELKANDHLSMVITAEAQFVDFFTLSANFNSLNAGISAIWRF